MTGELLVPPDALDGGPPSVRPPWPGETLEVAGQRLHVRRTPVPGPGAGSGPERTRQPAVFVHGLGGSATNWTDLMGELRDRLAGTALDLPGFGWSPPPRDRDYSLGGHARSVAALIEALIGTQGHGPVHLFGNSLGGAVALRVAVSRPELVRSVVLVSPALPHYRVRRSNAHLPALATPWLGERLARRLGRVSVERRVRATMALVYADPTAVPLERVQEAVEEARRRSGLPHDGEALLRSLRGVLGDYLRRGPEGLWQLAGRVVAPTLLVYGLRDHLVDPRTAQRAVGAFPRSRLVVLPRSGHVAQMEHPALVAHFVREHLDAPGLGHGADPTPAEAAEGVSGAA